MGVPLNIDWQQILLHLLNFVILAGGLYFLLYKPVKSFMAKRETLYAEREARIKQLEAEAEALKGRYAEKLQRAEEEVVRMREKAHDEIEAEKNRQLAEARDHARSIISTASQTAELRAKKAVDDAREEIRNMAVGMVEKLVMDSDADPLDLFLNETESEQGGNG